MREWLLIMCASAICSDTPAAVQVSEMQCREAMKVAEQILEVNRSFMRTGRKQLWESQRVICISPDGKTRLDNWPWQREAKSK